MFLKKVKVKRKLIYREIVGKLFFFTSICFVLLHNALITFCLFTNFYYYISEEKEKINSLCL